MPDRRPILIGAAFTIAAAVIGLASRQPPLQNWPIIGPWGGDAAWTIAACGGVRMLRPRWTTLRIALTGYALSVSVEISQLIHLPWLDAVRATRLGALLLGRGFLWTDLVAYLGGASIYGILDALLARGSTASTVPSPSDAEAESTGR